MPFFNLLEKIGITRKDLKEINGEDTIRIEKRLLAESKLDVTINKSDIYNSIDILTYYRPQVQALAYDEGLYNILSGRHATYYRIADSMFYPDNLRKLQEVINKYFTEDIIAYISTATIKNNWADLYIVLQYKEFISENTFDILKARLEAKLEGAMGLMQQHVQHRELHKNAKFLLEEDFYILLANVDKRYFLKYIGRLLKFIQTEDAYAQKRSYFNALMKAMLTFSDRDYKLKDTIQAAINRYGGEKNYSLIILISMVVLIIFVIGVSLKSSDANTDTPKPYINMLEQFKDRDSVSKLLYIKEERRLNWINFLNARRLPLLDLGLQKMATPYKPKKYANPFSLWIFSKDNNELQKLPEKLLAFNNTPNECVLLLFYSESLYKQHHYALYIPPNDSIMIDYRQYSVNFYAGQELKQFNNYKSYVYNDSLDYKFSFYNNVEDDLLTKQAHLGDKEYKKPKRLTLSMPDDNHYGISWDGEADLFPEMVYDSVSMPGQKVYMFPEKF